MEVIKTTVGHALKQLVTENVAFTIASFLVEDPEEKKKNISYYGLQSTENDEGK